MFTVVWHIYFDAELARKSLLSIFGEFSLIALSSIITTYIAIKFATTLIEKSTDLTGFLTRLIAGSIPALAVGMLGLIWASYCDDMYRNANR
jgi:hypothetical protein